MQYRLRWYLIWREIGHILRIQGFKVITKHGWSWDGTDLQIYSNCCIFLVLHEYGILETPNYCLKIEIRPSSVGHGLFDSLNELTAMLLFEADYWFCEQAAFLIYRSVNTQKSSDNYVFKECDCGSRRARIYKYGCLSSYRLEWFTLWLWWLVEIMIVDLELLRNQCVSIFTITGQTIPWVICQNNCWQHIQSELINLERLAFHAAVCIDLGLPW